MNSVFLLDKMTISTPSKEDQYSSTNGKTEVTSDSTPDFSEYMWMENEEEFDNQFMKQLEEEALMEQCIEAMLDDEQEQLELLNSVNGSSKIGNEAEAADLVKKSTLNPNAAEFVPRSTKPSFLREDDLLTSKD